jgi:hypothetical protein
MENPGGTVYFKCSFHFRMQPSRAATRGVELVIQATGTSTNLLVSMLTSQAGQGAGLVVGERRAPRTVHAGAR